MPHAIISAQTHNTTTVLFFPLKTQESTNAQPLLNTLLWHKNVHLQATWKKGSFKLASYISNQTYLAPWDIALYIVHNEPHANIPDFIEDLISISIRIFSDVPTIYKGHQNSPPNHKLPSIG